jgi:hypothetical protein
MTHLSENPQCLYSRLSSEFYPVYSPCHFVYRGDVANRALELAGRECGLFTEKREHTHKTPYDNMTLEQLVAEVEREAKLALEYKAPVIIDNELEGGE